MKKLYYGAYEYIETKENPGKEKSDLIHEYRNAGYYFFNLSDGTPAIAYEGRLYKQGKKYREYESVGKRIHDKRGAL